jgi:ligand-binding SRPBCC domain-containing protein
MIHKKQQIQFLPITIQQAWDYFSRPENLNEITPPDLQFNIQSELPAKMYQGQMIVYKISPFKGIKFTWLTEITHVNEPHFFVDEQRYGPYKLWHHEHHFKEVDGGIEMMDIVYYQLPLGAFGNLFHGLLIQPKLQKIFDFRKKALSKKLCVN